MRRSGRKERSWRGSYLTDLVQRHNKVVITHNGQSQEHVESLGDTERDERKMDK